MEQQQQTLKKRYNKRGNKPGRQTTVIFTQQMNRDLESIQAWHRIRMGVNISKAGVIQVSLEHLRRAIMENPKEA